MVGHSRVGVVLRQVQGAAPGRDQRQRHDLLVHGWDAGARAVRTHLRFSS